jgi:hypothetical protein
VKGYEGAETAALTAIKSAMTQQNVAESANRFEITGQCRDYVELR